MSVRSVCIQHFFFMEEDANEVLSSIYILKKKEIEIHC